MRRPGETVEQFAERVDGEAKLAHARNGGTQIASGPITQQTSAKVTPHCAGISPDENAAWQLSDPGTPLCQAYARAFAESAAAHVRELRERDALPEPDRTPGAPHPDSFLASRGWHVNEHGIYIHRAAPNPQDAQSRRDPAGVTPTNPSPTVTVRGLPGLALAKPGRVGHSWAFVPNAPSDAIDD